MKDYKDTLILGLSSLEFAHKPVKLLKWNKNFEFYNSILIGWISEQIKVGNIIFLTHKADDP